MKQTLLYLDPGSGTYLLQVIIAAILGGLMYFKNGWIKIKSFFTKRKPEEGIEDQDLTDNENPEKYT